MHMSNNKNYNLTMDDVLTLRPEIIENDGLIASQIHLCDVDSDSQKLESDAEQFFNRTHLTDALEASLSRVRDSLQGKEISQLQVIYGPYGSGKSHHLAALYHYFNSSSIVCEWANSRIEGLCDTVPDDSLPIIVSLQHQQYEHLWEPFFDGLDYEPNQNYGDKGHYPTADIIQDAVGNRTVAFFVDHLSDWFHVLTGERKTTNLGFMLNLFEVSGYRDNSDIFCFMTTLDRNSEMMNTLNKTDPFVLDLSHISTNELLHHRLIGSIDDPKVVQSIVDQYIEAYTDIEDIDLPEYYIELIYDTYPFHPKLLDSLETITSSQADTGGLRDMLYLFSQVLRDRQKETDLITHSDIDAVKYNDELTRINVKHARVDRCCDDITESLSNSNITYGRSILSTVLLYSLLPSDEEGATLSDIILGTYRPGDCVNDIIADLSRVQNEADYLWYLDGRYVIREKKSP